MAIEADFVSDLNGTGDTTVSVSEGTVSSAGKDAVDVNNQSPVREPTAQPKKVDDKGEAGDKKSLSLRDQISTALKDGETTPPAASKDGKVRDPATGQFVAAPAVDPNAAAIPPVDPNAAVAAPAAPVVAPQGIDATVFQSLPAETQQYLARTMEDLNTRQQRFASLEQVEQVIAPRVEAWALNGGMTPAQALNQLFALSDFAGRDPAAFIQYMAKNNGVDLEALVLGQEPVDPKYSELEQRLARAEEREQRETQQRARAVHDQTVSSVAAFSSEKGQDGQLLRPYFEELGSSILPFITAAKTQFPNLSQNEVLQKAYDSACWGTESVRAKMQAAANTAGDAERLRAEAQKVERARNASVSVKSGTPASASAAPDQGSRSLRETITAAMAAAT